MRKLLLIILSLLFLTSLTSALDWGGLLSYYKFDEQSASAPKVKRINELEQEQKG